MTAREANFDGLVGPTHNYAGLAQGNLASQANAARVANPRRAAKEGLRKMRMLARLGFWQAVLPPHERPSLGLLRSLGFTGSDAAVLARAGREAPDLLAAAGSAAAMWTANAATVSPSPDTHDRRVHFTVANLASSLHRAIEADTTLRVLRAAFPDEHRFAVHPALPSASTLGDEGAANHTRLCDQYGARGVELFVHGRRGGGDAALPRRYPARQTLEASQAVARRHGLADDGVVFARQKADAIDAGVFHNDVIAVGNRDLLLCHEEAFDDARDVYRTLTARLARLGGKLNIVEVPRGAIRLEDAVASYLFNSQLLTRADGSTVMVVPRESRTHPVVWPYLSETIRQQANLAAILVTDLRESMGNGGGPACLRLRVVLDEAQRQAVNPALWLDQAMFLRLDGWIDRHYRDRLSPGDLADPALLDESRTALDELTRILCLGPLYDFQRDDGPDLALEGNERIGPA